MIKVKPLVSIIIPTFNRAHLIGETLDSIYAQTYKNWECIVVDDGSTDTTAAVLNRYIIKDSRFQYHHRPKNRLRGGNAARNHGFELSRGEYIQWFDSDDLMHPEKLKIDVVNLQSGNYDFTISQSSFFDENGKIKDTYWNDTLWSNEPLTDFIKKNIGWGINSSLWKRTALIGGNLFFDEKVQNGQDYLFHIEALIKKLNPSIIHKVLVYQRNHPIKIEHNTIKSKSKALILSYLLKKLKKKEINKELKDYVIKKSLLVLTNLYKTKSWKNALTFSFQLLKFPLPAKGILIIVKLFFLGSFYKLSSRGYSYI